MELFLPVTSVPPEKYLLPLGAPISRLTAELLMDGALAVLGCQWEFLQVLTAPQREASSGQSYSKCVIS